MDSSFVLLFLITIFTVVYYYLVWPYNYFKKQGVKTTLGIIPGFGNVLSTLLLRENPSSICNRLYKSCPAKTSMIGMFFVRTPTLIIREPELIKRVLVKDFQSFQNNLIHLEEDLDPFLANNAFFSWDNTWKEQRAKLINSMSQVKLKILFRIMQQVSIKFEGYLDNIVKTKDLTELDLKSICTRFTGELVANTAFGIEGGGFEANLNPQSFTGIVERLFATTLFSGMRLMLTFYLPNLSRTIKLSFIPRKVNDFFMKTVSSIVQHRSENGLVMDDLMQMSINAQSEPDPKVVAGHLSSFFFDAYESSAIIAAFAIFELSHYPDVQEKARREIEETLEKHNGKLTYESLKDMDFLDQVINETIRLHPILGVSLKVCTQKITLEGSDGQTCCLEPGHLAGIPVQSIHLDDEYWKNPTVFDPERFSEERKNELTKFAFLPFSEGPRMCAGMRYGIMTVKTILVTVLRKFGIEKSNKTKIPLKLEQQIILTFPEDGLWAKLKRINRIN